MDYILPKLRNKRGDIDIARKTIPLGYVLIRGAHLPTICGHLCIPYAVAMRYRHCWRLGRVGTQVGVVVREEDAQRLWDTPDAETVLVLADWLEDEGEDTQAAQRIRAAAMRGKERADRFARWLSGAKA